MKNTYSQRQQRVATLINAILVEILQQGVALKNYTSNCPITITKVTVTPDLKNCDCYFLPFNTKMSPTEIKKLLQESSFAIRKIVTDKINLKYSPQIIFHYDKGFDNTSKVEEILKQIKSPI